MHPASHNPVYSTAGPTERYFCTTSTQAVEPPVQSVLGLFPGRELNHLPSCIAQVKNEWSHTTAPPVCFRGVHIDFTSTSTASVRNIFRPDKYLITLEMFALTHLDPLKCPICPFLTKTGTSRHILLMVSNLKFRETRCTHSAVVRRWNTDGQASRS
jgi:hypothetical protein